MLYQIPTIMIVVATALAFVDAASDVATDGWLRRPLELYLWAAGTLRCRPHSTRCESLVRSAASR